MGSPNYAPFTVSSIEHNNLFQLFSKAKLSGAGQWFFIYHYPKTAY